MSNVEEFVFIGAAVADKIITISHEVSLAASNICRTKTVPGGVARNTAESFVHLGGNARLITKLGNDDLGNWLAKSIHSTDIELLSLPSTGLLPTATYSAVLDAKGELVIGLADMEILEQFSEQDLFKIKTEISNTDYVFMDAGLSEFTLETVSAETTNSFLALAAVSPEKSSRIVSSAPLADFLFCNRAEAAAMTKSSRSRSIEYYVAGLLELGFSSGIITDGPAPLCLFTSGTKIQIPVPKLKPKAGVNGAGDALAAGILFGIQSGKSYQNSITEFGFQAVSYHLSR